MHSDKIKKYLITGLVIGLGATFIYLALNTKTGSCPFQPLTKNQKIEITDINEPPSLIEKAREFLRIRKNMEALVILDKILSTDPNNLDAICGKAEVFRRARQYKLAELMFKDVLNARPDYAPALIRLSYIKANNGDFKESISLAEQAFITSENDRQNRALAYMIFGLINNAARPKPGIISGINHGLTTKNYLLKAVELAPELPETHLNLGTFYLKAPMFQGRDLNNAIKELEYALNMAPDYPEANARLAQAYKMKRQEAKFKFYFDKAKSLDPNSGILREIELNGGKPEKLYHQERIMMGTVVEATSQEERALKIVFDEIGRVENLLSRYIPESEISKLNRLGRLKVSPETFFVIKKSKEFYLASNGSFDITIAPLMDLWGFTDKQYRVPEKRKIKETLKLVGSDKIILRDSDNMVQFKIPGMKLDLGGIAKGYALDCAAKKLKEAGIKNCLINAGGQIYCLGKHFNKPWRIGIAPSRGNKLNGYLDLTDKSSATSGDYEQYFSAGKIRYSHILNPKTGYPADSKITSVTVIANDGITADALATAIFVLGKDKGRELSRQFNDIQVKIYE